MHLGADKLVKLKDIIMIVNLENSQKPQEILDFVKNSGRKTETIEGDTMKSVVITDQKIYYTPISSQTLKKRANFVADLEKMS
jgi:hypothetical protein